MYRFGIKDIAYILVFTAIILFLLELGPCSNSVVLQETKYDTVWKHDTIIRYLPKQVVRVKPADTVIVTFDTRDTVVIVQLDTVWMITYLPRPDTVFRDTVTITVEKTVIQQNPDSFWDKLTYIAAGLGSGVLLMLIVK
jgi:hypothetical protein